MKRIFKRAALLVGLIAGLYFGLFDHTPHGRECRNSAPVDGIYRAELCLLRWAPGRSGSPEYVGRLFDAKSGRLLAQRTFSTPVPDLFWSTGLRYSLNPYSPPRYLGPSVEFSRGDAGKGDARISLPPSFWDKLAAARPRL
ncbi:hypothetical protein HDG40_000046 [Paraburkholderia sp. JPY158]|uniref:Uncharacterized protein n=1 Tax=Paraburkholderia atlantica TaxID=2654982 RepID=A0A7W8Q261_PARAM|nr:hypothetical protein [Paraburkholderia atlantica]MBB5421905.1 hypothetical protein [Paraburkholderia atlantica]